ncbi:MAG: PQQ-like beta-propeller repeat protein, partial [Bacteroidales bacterium]|nr:PQQ-like beta-propeller repeat protein [Bacteroidales bacterium]
LSVDDGETVWETDRDVKISWASPVIASTPQGPQLILAADPFVISYNPDNGEEIWKLKCLSGEVGPSVAVGGNMVFALNEYASLVGISVDGEPKVIWEDFDYLSDVPSPVATDKYLIVSTSYGVIACHEIQTGEKLWEAEFDNSIYSSPQITEGKVYLIDKKGITHIFKADKDYLSIAELPLGEGSVCTPAFSDGRIYIRGEKHLFCIGEM